MCKLDVILNPLDLEFPIFTDCIPQSLFPCLFPDPLSLHTLLVEWHTVSQLLWRFLENRYVDSMDLSVLLFDICVFLLGPFRSEQGQSGNFGALLEERSDVKVGSI